MSDDDYVEGDSRSEAADAPEREAPARDAKQGGFDSGSVSDAPVMHRPKTAARMAESRKAFAAAVLANKDKPAKVAEHDILDPEEPAPIAALAVAAKAKAEAAPVPDAPKPAAPPPAPSLDPEVRALRESLKSERDAIAKERAELEKQRAKPEAAAAAPSSAPDLESYIDNAPSWLRGTFEAMRADKMTDEEFKAEVADLITMLSGDVLGVPLPESVRTKLEAAQAKKMVRTHKTIMSRKEAEAKTRAEREQVEATTKAEAERVETEWKKASESLSSHMQTEGPSRTYPWLAAEDDPGGAIVDVIRSQLAKDGTNLKWDEAAKLANDYLAENAKRYYDKRKPLLSGEPAKPAAPKPAAATPPPPAAAVPPPVTQTPSGNQRWNNDKHREQTRAAFRAQLGKTE